MRHAKRTLALAVVSVAALIAAPTLYAHDAQGSSDSMTRGGMMGGGGMMGRMNQMMDHCGAMMRSGPRSNRPNDQWREDRPTTPDKSR